MRSVRSSVVLTCLTLFAMGSASAQSDDVVGPPVPEDLLITGHATSSDAVPAPSGIPLALVRAVEIATLEHPNVRRALADRRASASELRGARWQRFPSLTVEGLAVTQGNENTSSQSGLTANVVLEQPIWTAGRIGATIDGARAGLNADTYAVADTQVEMALSTIGAYFDLALATRRETILRESLTQHEDLLETITRRVEQEVSPRADLELAGSRAAQIEQDLAAVRGLRASSYNRLMELVGYADIDLGGVPMLDPTLTVLPEEELVRLALDCSPRLKSLRFLQSEVEAQRRVARSRIFPQVVAQATHNEITGTRAGVTLRVQTGNGLSQFSAVDAAEAQIESARFQLATTEREVREQIRSDYLTFETGRTRASASERATRSADLVTDSYRRQFITGRRTWLDVMNAVRESMSARLTEADAQLGAMAAYSRLMVRSCLWTPTPLALEDE